MNMKTKKLPLLFMLAGCACTVSAQTWEENLEKGAATTEKNHLNVPFVEPENWRTAYGTVGNWASFLHLQSI